MRRLARPCTLVVAAVLLSSAPARPDEGAGVAHAHTLFEQGKRLMQAKDWERALQHFRASRLAHPGKGNTRNAAHCLGELERWDEALEMYEELLGSFGAELSPDDRAVVAEFMTRYRQRVGSLDVSANVHGQLIVDSRPRGALPLTAALHVLPGPHLVRIVKEGYVPYESTIEVRLGQVRTIDARLEPLGSVGRLRVEVDLKGELARGSTLSIDGSPVGPLPWEGSLAPGPHVLFASAGDLGSDLARVVVVQSQLVTTTLTAKPLGAPLRLSVDPPTGQVLIDGVAVGRGGFEGRHPVGEHEIAMREDGYAEARFTLRSTNGRAEERRVALAVDPRHPRWRSGLRFRAEVVAAPLVTTSLGSGAEDRARGAPASGGSFAGRLGLEFPFRLAVDLTGGWLVLSRSVQRAVGTSYMVASQVVPVRYEIADALRVRGPFAGLGLRQRLPFGHDRFDLRLGLGLAIGGLAGRDLTTTTATSGGRTTPAATDLNGASTTTVTLFVTPEVDARYRRGPFEVGVGLGVMALLVEGRPLTTGETRVGGCPPAMPLDVRCAPGTRILEGEQSFGRFVAWAPRLTLGWSR